MKKYITFLIVLVFSIFIGLPNAYAIKIETAFEGGAYSTGITWNGYGANDLRTGEYTDHVKVAIVNGHKYPAFCLDPGLHLNSGTVYECTPSSDAGLYQLVKAAEGGDYTLVQLSIRFYAQMKGYGNAKGKAMKTAIARYWQIRSGYWDLISEGCTKEGTECSSDPNAYLSGNTALI